MVFSATGGCSSDECLAVDYNPAPMRLSVDAAGEAVCAEGVIVTPIPAATADEKEARPLEVVTYEDLCEHRVHGWYVDGEALTVVVSWESEDGDLFDSEPTQLPVATNSCGDVTGGELDVELVLADAGE